MLAAQLPGQSRCSIHDDPDALWDDSTRLLRALDYQLREMAWSMSDKRSRGPEPKPAPTPSEARARADRARRSASRRDEVRKRIGLG